MDTSKIIKGIVNARGYTVTKAITQWDYGYVFVPEFEDMPATYRLDFSNDEHHGTALPVYCGSEGGEVPEELIDTGKDIYVWFYYIGDGYGKSTYEWRIPNHCKPKTEEDEPTPSQQSSIDQAIARSNEAVEQAEQSASDASQSAQSAQGYAEQAESARDTAQGYASNAQLSATQANNSAISANQSASASAQSASEAEAARQGTTDLVAEAQRYADASEQSATASANSAEQAHQFAQTASLEAESAQDYATQADISANTASTKASEASQSATTASQKATESAQSASQALSYKTDAESAKTASQTAQGLAESARDSAIQAKNDAESAGDAVQASASQIAQNTTDIADLKSGLSDIEDEIVELPKTVTPEETEADLYISDANGNVLAEFSEGHIKTKKFDSADIGNTAKIATTNAQTDLDIADANGFVAVRIKNGAVITPNFNSNNAVDGEKVAEIIDDEFPDKYLNSYRLNGIKWDALGDSLTDPATVGLNHKNYTRWIAEANGISLNNLGVGGRGYWQGIEDEVANIRSDTDIVTIFGSLNDITNYIANPGVPTDTWAGGKTNYCARARRVFDAILAVRNDIRIGVILPTPWVNYNCYDTATATQENVENMLDALKGICKIYGIPVLDMYHGSNLRPWDSDFRTAYYVAADGYHPNELGNKLFVAPQIEAFLRSLAISY